MSLEILLYTDFIWPFCYIAEGSSLVRLQKEYDVTINWRGFELHPEIPVGGMLIEEYFPKERVRGMKEYLQQFAQRFGMDIAFTEHMPNTRKALAMAEYAREKNNLEPFRTGAMKAYWKKGEDLENEALLKAIARGANLDPDKALQASEDSRYLQRIDTIRAEANEKGVTGIPTILLGTEKVVGCQTYETVVSAGKKAGMLPV